MAKSAKKIAMVEKRHAREDSLRLASAWSPLRESVFRALWIATVVSNIGTWMQDVGESWLMTSLTSSPVLVALVETAGSLPVVLVALPAGALADVVDRRRLLLVMQIWMFVAASAMGIPQRCRCEHRAGHWSSFRRTDCCRVWPMGSLFTQRSFIHGNNGCRLSMATCSTKEQATS